MGAGFLVFSTSQVKAQDSCQVTIVKVADPVDDTPFNFSVTGDQNFEFTLSDPSDTTEIIGLLAEEGQDTVTLTELTPPGWLLDNIECTEGQVNCGATPCLTITELPNGQGVVLTCLDNDTGSCTFTNSAKPLNIPTLSQWGLIVMAGILVLIGIWGITRKKAEA